MESSVVIGLNITIFLILMGLIFHNRLVFIMQVIWIILVGSFNTYSVDWINNLETYQIASIPSFNLSNLSMFFYNYLSVKCKNVGMEYENFNMILSSVSTILIMYVVLKCSKNPAIVGSLILIYPFIDDIIQKRWYYAMAVMIFGIYLSLKSNNRFNRLAVLFISAVVSIQFHQSAILFFTIPLFMLLTDKYKKLISILVLIIGTIFRGRIVILVNAILGSGMSEKTTLYFSTLAGNSTLMHYLFWTAWQLSQVLIIYSIYKRNPNNKNIHSIWNLNLWSICLIPLYSFDPVFSRIFRPIIIFNYIVIANSLWHEKWNVSKFGLMVVLSQITLALISLFVFDLNSELGIQAMIFDVFQHNQFLLMSL